MLYSSNAISFVPKVIFEDSQNRILIGGKRLYVFNDSTGSLAPIVKGSGILEEITFKNEDVFITSMAETANGSILLLLSDCYSMAKILGLTNSTCEIVNSEIDAMGAWSFSAENKDRIWLIGGDNIAHLDSVDIQKSNKTQILDLIQDPHDFL